MNNIIQMIPIGKLQPFENHPFKLRGGEEQERLRESIRRQGQIEPLIVCPLGENYEGISGHRRLEICRELQSRAAELQEKLRSIGEMKQ